jgi:CRP-like cAMP-binding protein
MTFSNLTAVDLIGYLAALLVFSTFYMKTMVPLRSVAIASNVAFITYGYLAALYPILLLHLVLLPLNIWRLYQLRRLLTRVRRASEGNYSIESMLPFMTKAEFKKADVLFRRGEPADKLYYLVSGSVRFPEIQATAAPGDLIGEIGVFSPWKERTASAVVESDSTLLTLSDQKVLELYYQDPEFGIYLVRMVIRHLMHQRQVAQGSTLLP